MLSQGDLVKNLSLRKVLDFQPHLVIQPCQLRPAAQKTKIILDKYCKTYWIFNKFVQLFS